MAAKEDKPVGITGVFPPVKGEEALCQCAKCFHTRHKEEDYPDIWDRLTFFSRMFLCSICGNKRCPHATDHELACTHSNESGQKGSAYE
jgi:hypothetical protein